MWREAVGSVSLLTPLNQLVHLAANPDKRCLACISIGWSLGDEAGIEAIYATVVVLLTCPSLTFAKMLFFTKVHCFLLPIS